MMQVALIPPDRIETDWPVLAEMLWPAVRQDATYNLRGLYDRLQAGAALLFEASGDANGLWVISVVEDAGLVAWTTAIVGVIDGGPKRRLRTMREAVGAIERVAREAGCKAHRICGRDYSRLFPDYRPYEGARNGLEKVLA